MDHQRLASQLVMTWKSEGGLESQDLQALTKLITTALRDAERKERRMWLEAMDDREAGEHVIKSIRLRFPRENDPHADIVSVKHSTRRK